MQPRAHSALWCNPGWVAWVALVHLKGCIVCGCNPGWVHGVHQCNPGCVGCCRVGWCTLGAAERAMRWCCCPQRCIARAHSDLHPSTPHLAPPRSTSTWPAPTAAVRVFVLALLPRRACYEWNCIRAAALVARLGCSPPHCRCAAAHPCPVPPQTCRASRACCLPPSPRAACRRRPEGWWHGQLGWAAHGMTARAP